MDCQLCEVAMGETKHHLIPKCKKGKSIIHICQVCHSKVNSQFTNKELASTFNTLESLKNVLKDFIEWRVRHPNFKGTFKMSNDRKRKGTKYS